MRFDSDLSTSSLLNFESVPISTPIILFPRFFSSGASSAVNCLEFAVAVADVDVDDGVFEGRAFSCSENFLFATETEEAIIKEREIYEQGMEFGRI